VIPNAYLPYPSAAVLTCPVAKSGLRNLCQREWSVAKQRTCGRAWRPPLDSESCCAVVMSGTLGAACGCTEAFRRSARMREEEQVILQGKYFPCFTTVAYCRMLEVGEAARRSASVYCESVRKPSSSRFLSGYVHSFAEYQKCMKRRTGGNCRGDVLGSNLSLGSYCFDYG
jgi:hypothetical protein